MVDSDGNLFITTYPSPRAKLGYVFVVGFSLGLAETERSRWLLGYLKDRYGGNIQTQLAGRRGRKTALLLYSLRHSKARRLIQDVSPHLILKGTQARLCLRALDIQATPLGERDPDWSEALQNCRERISSLNSKKGRHALFSA